MRARYGEESEVTKRRNKVKKRDEQRKREVNENVDDRG